MQSSSVLIVLRASGASKKKKKKSCNHLHTDEGYRFITPANWCIQCLNNKGLRTEPWGTPQNI